MFSLPDEFYMFSFELRVFQFLGPPSPPFDTGGDTRPTSLAGHLLLETFVRDFACKSVARQGPFWHTPCVWWKKKVCSEAFVCMQTVVEKTRE